MKTLELGKKINILICFAFILISLFILLIKFPSTQAPSLNIFTQVTSLVIWLHLRTQVFLCVLSKYQRPWKCDHIRKKCTLKNTRMSERQNLLLWPAAGPLHTCIPLFRVLSTTHNLFWCHLGEFSSSLFWTHRPSQAPLLSLRTDYFFLTPQNCN